MRVAKALDKFYRDATGNTLRASDPVPVKLTGAVMVAVLFPIASLVPFGILAIIVGLTPFLGGLLGTLVMLGWLAGSCYVAVRAFGDALTPPPGSNR